MADRDELCGRTVGEFVLRERIGEGGFGAVYRCEQPLLGREAVVKVLHHRLRGNDVVRQRFLREARLASRLDHPYAAHVYAFGVERDDGMFWIAMEMVHGTTLDRWLEQRGPLALDQLVPFFERVAEVVHTAHERGIVHRDLKPTNIMVIERAGRLLPKLLDFGIAKFLDDGAPQAVETVAPRAGGDATLTLTNTGDPDANTVPDRRLPGARAASTWGAGASTGASTGASIGASIDAMSAGSAALPHAAALTHANATLGSPPYMSPEQWREPLRVGPRSDLYALGIIAYEALTGRRPFSAPSIPAFAELHCRAAVPSVGPGFPSALDGFFLRALAKRVEERPATALELAEALRAASGLAGTPVRIDRPRWRRLPWLAGAGAVLAGAGTVLVLSLVPDDRAPGHASALAPVPAPAPIAPSIVASDAPAASAASEPGTSDPAPATVSIRIESQPSRADVFRMPSEIKVGTTPWDATVERAEGMAVFVVKKRGYRDGRIEVDLRAGAHERVALSPLAVRVRPSDSLENREVRRKGEPIDPFRSDKR